MKRLQFVSVILLSLSATAQTTVGAADDYLPSGYVVKASIERKIGKIFESGGYICAQDLTNPLNKYDYAYSFKLKPELEIVEYKTTNDNNGPAGILAERENNPNAQAGSLVIDSKKTIETENEIHFSGDSVDLVVQGNSFSFAPVASISGTLNFETKKLNIHVVGSFAQDLVLDCQKVD